ACPLPVHTRRKIVCHILLLLFTLASSITNFTKYFLIFAPGHLPDKIRSARPPTRLQRTGRGRLFLKKVDSSPFSILNQLFSPNLFDSFPVSILNQLFKKSTANWVVRATPCLRAPSSRSKYSLWCSAPLP